MMKDIITVEFKMNRVVVEQFAILRDVLPNDVSSIHVTWGVTYGAIPDQHLVACKMKFAYVDNEQQPILVLEVSIYYEIRHESWHNFIEDGKIVIPAEFQPTMMVHTVGTARGILFCKTEGTTLHSLVLPPLNVEQLVRGNFTVTV